MPEREYGRYLILGWSLGSGWKGIYRWRGRKRLGWNFELLWEKFGGVEYGSLDFEEKWTVKIRILVECADRDPPHMLWRDWICFWIVKKHKKVKNGVLPELNRWPWDGAHLPTIIGNLELIYFIKIDFSLFFKAKNEF